MVEEEINGGGGMEVVIAWQICMDRRIEAGEYAGAGRGVKEKKQQDENSSYLLWHS